VKNIMASITPARPLGIAACVQLGYVALALFMNETSTLFLILLTSINVGST
jgi:hypothetical protein